MFVILASRFELVYSCSVVGRYNHLTTFEIVIASLKSTTTDISSSLSISDCFVLFLDLIFLIDGSSSVGKAGFEQVKEWIMNLSNNFTIADGSTRIGVIQYSFYAPLL